jgi:hypothetical protein
VVEDSVSGLKSAYDAGIGCIIGLGGPAVRARLLACKGVALVIESLRDFPRELLLNDSQQRLRLPRVQALRVELH